MKTLNTYICHIVNHKNTLGFPNYTAAKEVDARNKTDARFLYKKILRNKGYKGMVNVYVVDTDRVWDYDLRKVTI